MIQSISLRVHVQEPHSAPPLLTPTGIPSGGRHVYLDCDSRDGSRGRLLGEDPSCSVRPRRRRMRATRDERPVGRARWAAASRARQAAAGSVMGAALDGALARESRSGPDAPMSMRQFNLPPKLRSPNRESSGTIAASKCGVAALPPLTAALLFVCVPAQAQVLVYEVFGAYLDSLRDQAGIPGLAAAIVDTDGIVWERAYGRQDIARSMATRTDTPFNADGLTQTITAAMVLRCAEERRLSLDDTVGSLRRRDGEPDASIRQLLTHTSGASRQPHISPSSRAARAAVADRSRVRRRFVSRDVRELAASSRDVRFGSRSQYRQRSRDRPKVCPIPTDVERYSRRAAAAGDAVFRDDRRRRRRSLPIRSLRRC